MGIEKQQTTEGMMSTSIQQGIVFALDRDNAKALFGARDNESLMAAVSAALQATPQEAIADCAGHWQAIHQMFHQLSQEDDRFQALDLCLLGGRQLQRESGLFVCVVRPDIVPIVAEALAALPKEKMKGVCAHVGLETAEEIGALCDSLASVFDHAKANQSATVFAALCEDE